MHLYSLTSTRVPLPRIHDGTLLMPIARVTGYYHLCFGLVLHRIECLVVVSKTLEVCMMCRVCKELLSRNHAVFILIQFIKRGSVIVVR